MAEIQPRNKKWTEDQLFEMRKEVLAMWPTGKEVDLDEAIEYHKQLPPEKSIIELNLKAKREGIPYVIKPLGRGTLEDQIEHMQLVTKAGIQAFDIFHDTYTRKCQYEKAEGGIKESYKQGFSMLNGYPIVNYGVYNTRKIIEEIPVPVRHWSATDEDPRLPHEIGLAAGCAGCGFHNVHDVIQHSRDYPLDRRVINDQYGTRLAAYYTEHGAPVDAFCPGNLNGWDPPEMKLVLNIVQTLMAAEQGVKYVTLAFVSTVHFVQNAAALSVMRTLMREYLDKFGYADVDVTVEFSTWQGDWPLDLYPAAAVNALDVTTAILGGADCVWVRGIDESVGLSAREADIGSAKIARKLVDAIGRSRLPESDEVKLEKEMITLAVRAIVDRITELGDGDVVIGVMEAVKQGMVDASFSPWVHLARRVLPVRDIDGAIRYLDHGNIPLPTEVVEYHRQKIDQRTKADGIKADIEMVINDVTYLSRTVA